jgi:hypothetical protein
MLSIFINSDDHLLLNMIDDSHRATVPNDHRQGHQAGTHEFVPCRDSGRDCRSASTPLISEEIRHLAKHAVIDEVPVGVLELPDLVLVLEYPHRRAQFP